MRGTLSRQPWKRSTASRSARSPFRVSAELVLRSATRMAFWLEDVVPVAARDAALEEEAELDEPLGPDDPPPLDEPLPVCPPLEPVDVEVEGTDTDGVEVEGTVATGVSTDGVVTVGVVVVGVVTVGVVTVGVVTVGVVAVGVVTDGTVTAGTVTEGTVTDGTVTDGTVTDGVSCAPAGNPLIPSPATTNVAPNHQRRRVIRSPSRRPGKYTSRSAGA
jgi:hypothetical protein